MLFYTNWTVILATKTLAPLYNMSFTYKQRWQLVCSTYVNEWNEVSSHDGYSEMLPHRLRKTLSGLPTKGGFDNRFSDAIRWPSPVELFDSRFSDRTRMISDGDMFSPMSPTVKDDDRQHVLHRPTMMSDWECTQFAFGHFCVNVRFAIIQTFSF